MFFRINQFYGQPRTRVLGPFPGIMGRDPFFQIDTNPGVKRVIRTFQQIKEIWFLHVSEIEQNSFKNQMNFADSTQFFLLPAQSGSRNDSFVPAHPVGK